MESTLRKPAFVAAKTTPKVTAVFYWIATALFCMQISFTAYAELRLPQVAEAFTHLGFPAAYFRVELSWAKLIGVLLLLAPVPARLKEWAYAGFAINLASAIIAHLAVDDGLQAWGWAAATGMLWGLSYFLWRRRLVYSTTASIATSDAPSTSTKTARSMKRDTLSENNGSQCSKNRDNAQPVPTIARSFEAAARENTDR